MKRLSILLFLAFTILGCESDATKAERFFIKGNMALDNGDYREAIRLYTEAVDKYPEFKSALNNRGVAQYKLGHYYEAIDDYTKLIMTMDTQICIFSLKPSQCPFHGNREWQFRLQI